MREAQAQAERLLPCYFFFGEESFLAFQFIESLKKTLFAGEGEEHNVERFLLEDHSWAEIIDLARTVPFFSSRRLVVIEIADAKKARLSATDKAILQEYFQSCSNQTVVVVIFSGKVRRDAPLVKFFSSLPSSVVSVDEIKPLRDRALFSWMEKEFRNFGKEATPDALRRLAEVAGNSCGRIHNEIEKIVLYVGEKNRVDVDDINQISGWVKSFLEWEIADNLEKGDYSQSLLVLDNLLNKEGTPPEYVLGTYSRYFSSLLLAKVLLAEKTDRKVIFKEMRPQIREKFGAFYTRKFNEFFALVESFSWKDLNRFLGILEDIDVKIKTTSLKLQTMLEGFLFDYCRFRREGRFILKGRR